MVKIFHESKRLGKSTGGCGGRLGALLSLLAASACAASSPSTTNAPAVASPGATLQAKVALDIAARERAAGDTSGAIAYYNSVVMLNSNLKVQAYIGLGDTLLDTGIVDEAADDYRKALELAPRNSQAQIGMGAALVGLNQPVAAIAELQRGMWFAPTARGERALAIAEDLLGNYQLAVSDSESGLALFPGDRGLREDLGLSEALAGDYDAAIATMQTVASSSDATARDRLNLALVLGLAGRDTDAAEAARGDLDATSIQSNLLYYAELRSLPVSARAIALLRPASMPAPKPAAISAVPAAPVEAAVASAPAMAPTVPVAEAPLPATAVVPAAAPLRQVALLPSSPLPSAVKKNPVAAASELPPAVETVSVPAASSSLPPVPVKPLSAPKPPSSVPPPAPRPSTVVVASNPAPPDYGLEAQLGALPTQDDALREWKLLQTQMPALLAGREPHITEIMAPPDGSAMYRLRTGGFASHADAVKFCSDVGAAGGACAVF